MPATVTARASSKEVQTLDTVRRVPVKAHLDSRPESTAVDPSPLDRLSSIKESALLAAHGSQKAAALEVGCDQSQMKRQLRTGTFDTRQEAAAGDAYLAKLGEMLVEEYGEARKSKRDLALERLPELFSIVIEGLTEDEDAR